MLKLYIGNQNYSSWSLRPWLVLKKAELPFEMKLIQLDVPGYKEKLRALSTSGTVPVLQVDEMFIPDSLAICEWASKCVPNLWPNKAVDKKVARALCQQMQDDFGEFREHAPMNLTRRTTAKMPKPCVHAAHRLADRWEDLLGRHDGPFLFEDWSIADAFATPYATRFTSYGLPRSQRVDTYISELMADADFLVWEAAGLAETWNMPATDTIGE